MDFRAYLKCGILAHGFARAGHPPKVGSEDCGHERLIPFSCKGRGLCPSCNTRGYRKYVIAYTSLPAWAAIPFEEEGALGEPGPYRGIPAIP